MNEDEPTLSSWLDRREKRSEASSQQAQQPGSGVLPSLHWAATLTCAAGCALLFGSDLMLDPGTRQLAGPVFVSSGLMWLAEFVVALLIGGLGRKLLVVPVVVAVAFVLCHEHAPFQLAWRWSQGAFDSALSELTQHPEGAQGFHRTLGMWEVDVVQTDPGTGSVYFETAGDESERPVFVHAPDGKPADWGSYRDCLPAGGRWQHCVWRF